jgi:hypothetical protein
MKLYYRLMVSSIYNAQKNGFMSDIWKFMSNLTMTVAMSSNILVVYVLINKFLLPDVLDFIEIKFTDTRKWNSLLNISIYIFFPCMIINYFLVFYEDKYKFLIKEFIISYKKAPIIIYSTISFICIFLLIFTKK